GGREVGAGGRGGWVGPAVAWGEAAQRAGAVGHARAPEAVAEQIAADDDAEPQDRRRDQGHARIAHHVSHGTPPSPPTAQPRPDGPSSHAIDEPCIYGDEPKRDHSWAPSCARASPRVAAAPILAVGRFTLEGPA